MVSVLHIYIRKYAQVHSHLLVEQSPEHRQRYEQHQNLQQTLDVCNQVAVVLVVRVIEPMGALLFASAGLHDRML